MAIAEVNVTQTFSKKNKMLVEPVPAFLLKQENESNPIYVYNVSKWDSWTRNVPGLGRVVIPKCPEDADFSTPITIRGMVRSYFDKGDRKKGFHHDEGIQVAKDLIMDMGDAGGGNAQALQNNLENHGCLIALKRLFGDPGIKAGDKVYTKAETEEILKKALNRLAKKNRQLVTQADAYWRGDQRQRSFICQRHQEAALSLKLKREWCAAGIEEGPKMVACDGCGNELRETAAFCASCKLANNMDAVKRLKLRVEDGFVVIGGTKAPKATPAPVAKKTAPPTPVAE